MRPVSPLIHMQLPKLTTGKRFNLPHPPIGCDSLWLSHLAKQEKASGRPLLIVTADAELIARGLPPCMCKVAQPETVAMFRSKPVDKS